MGLDMYLQAELYVPRPVEWMKDEARAKAEPVYNTITSLLPTTPSDRSYGVTVSYVVAYWRKANHIHKWFVDNVQDGIDECQRSYVSREQLSELLALCREVVSKANLIEGHVYNGSHSGPDTVGEWVDDYIEDKVIEEPEVMERLLPTQKGFFFGDTGYDEYYLQDVQDTIDQLSVILDDERGEDLSFYYQSSW